jgi:hypothetical protein
MSGRATHCPYGDCAQPEIPTKAPSAYTRAEVEIVLRHVEQDEQAEHHAHGVQGSAQELVDVKFADETVELLNEEGVVVALHNFQSF